MATKVEAVLIRRDNWSEQVRCSLARLVNPPPVRDGVNFGDHRTDAARYTMDGFDFGTNEAVALWFRRRGW